MKYIKGSSLKNTWDLNADIRKVSYDMFRRRVREGMENARLNLERSKLSLDAQKTSVEAQLKEKELAVKLKESEDKVKIAKTNKNRYDSKSK